MSAVPVAVPDTPRPSWLGIVVSLAGMLVLRWVFRQLVPAPDGALNVLLREISYFALAGGLLLYVRRVEGRPLRSIGLGTSRWWKSLLWGLATFVVCMAVALVLVRLTHYDGGAAGKAFERLPVGLVSLVVLRAGIVEELCYRGYAMERLRERTGSRWIAFVLPLGLFAVAHWTGGWANIVIALALGGILAGFYLLRRDLVANMFGHFLVDFVSNVLPRLAH